MNELTKSEAYSIAEHIDHTLLPEIRNDLDIDSMGWLRNMVHGYEKLCAFSGYRGATEPLTEEGTAEGRGEDNDIEIQHVGYDFAQMGREM